MVPKRKVLIAMGDVMCILLSIIISYSIIGISTYSSNFVELFNLIPILVVIWYIAFIVNDAYNLQRIDKRRFNANVIFRSGILSFATMGVLFYLVIPVVDFPQRAFLFHIISATLFLGIYRYFYSTYLKLPINLKKALIVGAGYSGRTIAHELVNNKPFKYNVVGFIDDDKQGHVDIHKKNPGIAESIPIVGTSEELVKKAGDNGVDSVILSVTNGKSHTLLKAISDCEKNGIPVQEMSHLYEELFDKIPVNHIGTKWFIYWNGRFEPKWAYHIIKRIFNLVTVSLALLFLMPVFLLISIAIRITEGGPVIYSQERVGKGGRVFRLFKFRTMVKNAEDHNGAQWADHNDPRITNTGRFLRRYHLDELPQLWNILKGEMSLVGPRPERPKFVEKLEREIPFYQRRHLVKPGITGWAQIKFNYAASVDESIEKFQYDLYYIKNRSFIFDILIILKTVEVVIMGRGSR